MGNRRGVEALTTSGIVILPRTGLRTAWQGSTGKLGKALAAADHRSEKSTNLQFALCGLAHI